MNVISIYIYVGECTEQQYMCVRFCTSFTNQLNNQIVRNSLNIYYLVFFSRHIYISHIQKRFLSKNYAHFSALQIHFWSQKMKSIEILEIWQKSNLFIVPKLLRFRSFEYIFQSTNTNPEKCVILFLKLSSCSFKKDKPENKTVN